MQNGPLDLICPVCEKEIIPRIWQARLRKPKKPSSKVKCPIRINSPLFCHNWPEDSDKQKQPCSGAEWPIRLVWPSLWERVNSPHLVRKTPKGPKSRVQVQNGPLDLIRLVCDRIFSPYLANKTSKSLNNSVHVQNGPLDLIRPVCEKGIIHRIWQARLRKA